MLLPLTPYPANTASSSRKAQSPQHLLAVLRQVAVAWAVQEAGSKPWVISQPRQLCVTGSVALVLASLLRCGSNFAGCCMMQGLSGRPAFDASDRASAEDFFLESLNAWRVKQGIKEKFILVGHSLGECLTTAAAGQATPADWGGAVWVNGEGLHICNPSHVCYNRVGRMRMHRVSSIGLCFHCSWVEVRLRRVIIDVYKVSMACRWLPSCQLCTAPP